MSGEDTAAAEAERFAQRHFDATKGPMWDFVDEFRTGAGHPPIEQIRAELESLLQERRLWFYIYPLPGEEGIAVEIRDVGGETPEESRAIGRRLIEEIYEEAFLKLTGQRWSHPTTLGT